MVVDLDLEAPGLHYKLALRAPSHGVVSMLSSILGDSESTGDLDRYAVSMPLPDDCRGKLNALLAGPAPSPPYWNQVRSLHRIALGGEGLLEAILELQARIREHFAPDYLLVDARTGVTELGGLATTAMADRVVLVATPNLESIEGTKAVADALRRAPTLGNRERSLHFVVSRVQGGEALDWTAVEEAFGEWSRLPNEPRDGAAERFLTERSARALAQFRDHQVSHVQFRRPREDAAEAGQQHGASLLAATLEWIASAFPEVSEAAQQARQRMLAVDRALTEMVSTRRHVGQWTTGRDAWRPDQVQANIRVETQQSGARTADLIVRHDPEDDKPAMVVEYVEKEVPNAVARWWMRAVRAPVVVILHGEDDRSIYSYERLYGPRFRPTDRWTLPSPEEFSLLDDPADDSLDCLLRAARKSRRYNERLIREWVHCSYVDLDGGMPWDAERNKRILDELATIDDVDLAAMLLAESGRGATHRDMWVHSGDDHLDRIVHEGFCAQLCWRLPAAAFMRVSVGGGPRGVPPALHGLQLVARILGLTYDPDQSFRDEAPTLLRPGCHDPLSLRDVFKQRRLRFSSIPSVPMEGWPPAASPHLRPEDRLAFHGFLGFYSPEDGTVELASEAVEHVASRLEVAPRAVGSIALLHLSTLALIHQATDLDGRRWQAFRLDEPGGLPGVAPPLPIVLAQVFTDRVLRRLADKRLTTVFSRLTDHQDPPHRSWRQLRHVSLETARAWLLAARRGCPPPLDLDKVLHEEAKE